MPGLDCEKLSCVEQKYVEDKLCQSRNVKSRKVQVKICPTKVGEAHFWCRPGTFKQPIFVTTINFYDFPLP